MKITPKNWGQNFLHIDSCQEEAVAETYPPIGKQDNSFMTRQANGHISNCPQLRLSPRKYQKRDRVQICGVLFKPFSHTNEIDHKNEHSLTITKQIKSSTSLHFARSYTQLNDDK